MQSDYTQIVREMASSLPSESDFVFVFDSTKCLKRSIGLGDLSTGEPYTRGIHEVLEGWHRACSITLRADFYAAWNFKE